MTIDIYEQLSIERKQGQLDGTIPDWMTTGGYQIFKQKYLYEAANPKEQFRRIANTAAKHAPKAIPGINSWAQQDYWSEKFFEVLWKGHVACSTPVLANMGTNRGCPVSCAGSVIEDSVEGFYDAYREIAILTKQGFGTATDLTPIRKRGSPISVGGKASGVLPVIKHFVQDMRDVSQGQARRGAWAGYLDIEHGDFWEVVQYLEEQPDGLNLGWIISDKFIAKLQKGSKEAVKRYQRALKAKMIFGKGYFFFIDKVNRHRPQMYKDLGLKVASSQLCAEIMLHSNKDYTYSCVLSWMNIAKADEWENTDAVFVATVFLDCVVSEFIEQAKSIRGMEKTILSTEKGRAIGLGAGGLHTYMQEHDMEFGGIPAHLFNGRIFRHIDEESLKASKWLAKELGEPEWCKGHGVRFTHRCVSGDTKVLTKDGQRSIETLVGKEVDVWNGNEWSSVVPFETGVDKLLKVTFSNGQQLKCTADHKFFVATPKRDPLQLGGFKVLEVEAKDLRVGDCMPKFFTGSFDTGKDFAYAYESGLFCGDGSIYNSKAGMYPRNELRLYGSKMALSSKVQWKSSTTWGGADCVRGYLPDDVLAKYVVPFGYSVKSKTEWLCGLIDADGSVSSRGISLSMKDYTFASDVSLLVQELGGNITIVKCQRQGGYNTDCAIHYQVYISLHSCNKIFQSIKPYRVDCPTTEPKTKIGKYHLNEVVSVEQTGVSEMTYCFTEPKLGAGVFNGIQTKQCAVAPTKSTALIYGGISEGIGPDVAMSFTQLTAAGEVNRVNPTLLALIKKKGLDIEKCIADTVISQGSVQNVSWLTDDEKKVFKTAFEINQRDILRLAATRQKYIDQGQSINLYFSGDAEESLISEIHQEAFENENILSLYYVYSSRGVVSSSSECAACM